MDTINHPSWITMESAMKIPRLMIFMFLPMLILACGILIPTVETPGTSTIPAASSSNINEKEGGEINLTSTSITSEFLLSLTPVPTLFTDSLYEAENILLADEIFRDGDSFVFDVQSGSPIAISAWDHGCDWMGIAGQIFNAEGIPVGNLVVEAGGYLEGHPILGLSLTGLAGSYGPGGYEIQLLDHLVESDGTIWVQVKDIAGNSLSPQIYLETFTDCDQNLIVLNLVEIDKNPEVTFYYPIIFR
jgi:hypothetical protein